MTTFVHRPINFAPYATNVLDCVGREDLFTPDGRKVTIARYGMGFQIHVLGDAPYYTDNNLSASYYLNMREVGVHDKQPAQPPYVHRERAARIRTLSGAIEAALQMASTARKLDQQDDIGDPEPAASLMEIERLLHDALIETQTALARAEANANIEIDVARALRKREAL